MMQQRTEEEEQILEPPQKQLSLQSPIGSQSSKQNRSILDNTDNLVMTRTERDVSLLKKNYEVLSKNYQTSIQQQRQLEGLVKSLQDQISDLNDKIGQMTSVIQQFVAVQAVPHAANSQQPERQAAAQKNANAQQQQQRTQQRQLSPVFREQVEPDDLESVRIAQQRK